MGCGLEGTQAEIDAMLNLTNYHRSLHGSPPLVWNDSLAATAKDWSEQCTINHSEGKYYDGNYGENTVSALHPNCVPLWTYCLYSDNSQLP
ncbi:hypothetical protein CHLNCDRAFT_144630 [Chlorella variabilis]|uniref:SCP domain-containing protein n=1 Tax=Chlorella variabilis TaxID=554065 RepID=E1ZUS4_CHLVA|nr:hypothetical protein CHLNCDRAFT_144630 [Chlorella variabilis]EFN50421.1 hypothetical protein CHLNCDRAFT_144630 [Chlorella variabilis]|eukprot:XP_005842553.1 hypothetical protein CHLNCDRAFT_144630 [Chlorella variabilis]